MRGRTFGNRGLLVTMLASSVDLFISPFQGLRTWERIFPRALPWALLRLPLQGDKNTLRFCHYNTATPYCKGVAPFGRQGLNEATGSRSTAEARQGWGGDPSVTLGATRKKPTRVYETNIHFPTTTPIPPNTTSASDSDFEIFLRASPWGARGACSRSRMPRSR